MFCASAVLQNVIAFSKSFQEFGQNFFSVRFATDSFLDRDRSLTKIVRECRAFDIDPNPDDHGRACRGLNRLSKYAAKLPLISADIIWPLDIRSQRTRSHQGVCYR